MTLVRIAALLNDSSLGNIWGAWNVLKLIWCILYHWCDIQK